MQFPAYAFPQPLSTLIINILTISLCPSVKTAITKANYTRNAAFLITFEGAAPTKKLHFKKVWLEGK